MHSKAPHILLLLLLLLLMPAMLWQLLLLLLLLPHLLWLLRPCLQPLLCSSCRRTVGLLWLPLLLLHVPTAML
jgi:hypothetical protein